MDAAAGKALSISSRRSSPTPSSLRTQAPPSMMIPSAAPGTPSRWRYFANRASSSAAECRWGSTVTAAAGDDVRRVLSRLATTSFSEGTAVVGGAAGGGSSVAVLVMVVVAAASIFSSASFSFSVCSPPGSSCASLSSRFRGGAGILGSASTVVFMATGIELSSEIPSSSSCSLSSTAISGTAAAAVSAPRPSAAAAAFATEASRRLSAMTS